MHTREEPVEQTGVLRHFSLTQRKQLQVLVHTKNKRRENTMKLNKKSTQQHNTNTAVSPRAKVQTVFSQTISRPPPDLNPLTPDLVMLNREEAQTGHEASVQKKNDSYKLLHANKIQL